MRRILLLLGGLLTGSVALAQLDSYTVTVKASQTLGVQPDQALIRVDVETSQTAGIEDFIGALNPIGITAANLIGVNTVYGAGSQQQNAIDWSFTLAVPLTNLSATLNGLAKLQKSMSLSFSVAGLQISPQLQASQLCPLRDLFLAAQSRAVALAQAAGFGLGSVLSISDGSDSANTQSSALFVFDAVSGIVSASLTSAPTVCTIVAKFGLKTGP